MKKFIFFALIIGFMANSALESAEKSIKAHTAKMIVAEAAI